MQIKAEPSWPQCHEITDSKTFLAWRRKPGSVGRQYWRVAKPYLRRYPFRG